MTEKKPAVKKRSRKAKSDLVEVGENFEPIEEPTELDIASAEVEADEALIDDIPELELNDDELSARRDQEDFEAAGPSTDTVHDYLRQIGQVKLLTHEEEKDLARRIEIGLYAEKVLAELAQEQGGEVDFHYQRDLEWVSGDGKRAKRRLTEANYRLVVSLAKRYSSKTLRFQDLIQEGNNGLVRAVEKFDYTRKFRFSTYATFWIRQSITRAMADQGRTIRIPVHMVEIINRLNRVTKDLAIDLGHIPSTAEIAGAMEMEEDKIIEIQKFSREPSSIYQTLGQDGDTEVGDLIEDTSQPDQIDVVSMNFVRDRLFSVLEMLSPKERNVIVLRYGLRDQVFHTLDEIGRLLGLTRERIRQIEQRAMDKLSHAAFSSAISDFGDDLKH